MSTTQGPSDTATLGQIDPGLPLLIATGLSYRYGGSAAVVSCGLSVRPGTVVALIGGNGAGKTTTVKMIAGALRPQTGQILFEGVNLAGIPAHQVVERGITLVPEGRLVFQHMTVLENLLVGGSSKRGRMAQSRNIERIFGLFPRLAERRHQSAGSMSGGEQQMLAIGRGLMTNPRLLILDEPSLGLSPKFVRLIFGLIHTLNAEGMSILLVEQNVNQALAIADHAYVIEKGRVVRDGPGPDLLGDRAVREAFLGGA